MFYWQGSLLFGVIILTAWNQFTVRASYDLLELIFPIACYDDPSIMTSLQNKDLVNIAVFQHTPLWMRIINNATFKQKDSIICRRSFNISNLFLRKKSKVYVNVDVNPDVYYGCPFNFMLYSGDSAQPIEEIKCRTVFSKSLHWPDGNLTVAFKFNLRSVITPFSNNGTKISIQVGTCKNCFHMETIPQVDKRPIKPKTYHNVLLPSNCATRACLDYRPFKYTITLQSGLYINQLTQMPCYVKFDLRDERRPSRIKTCLKFSWIGRKKYEADINVHPFSSEMLIVLKVDGVTYMEFRSIVMEQFWCLPDNWLKRKSLITIEFGDYTCCKGLWVITVQSNFSSGLYYTMCDRTPYQEVLSSFLRTTTTTSLSDPETSLVEHDERPMLQSVILPAGLCTIFVAIISVVVVCMMHRRRSRSQPRARSAVRQNVHQGPRQSRTESNPTYGLTQMEELTPVIQEPRPTDHPSADQPFTELDLPPPYPGDDGAPPSYEEVCHILPAQGVQK